MSNYKGKAALVELIETGKIKDKIKCYPKPLGSLCSVSVCPETGANIFLNNESEFIDSDFGKYLVEFGITGDIIVKTDGNVRGTTKWLNYNLNNVPFEEWYDKVVISQLGINKDLQPSALHVENINPIMIPYDQLYYRNNQLAKLDTFDGLIVEATDIDNVNHQFYLVPTRYIQAKVLSIIKDESDNVKQLVIAVVHQNKSYRLLIENFTARTRAHIDKYGINVDQSVTIQYTSFFGGNRLVNFASAILVTIKK